MSQDSTDDIATTFTKLTRKSVSIKSAPKTSVCFFCHEIGEEPLHESSTFGMDERVREAAMKLNDSVLLAQLSAGDLIAQEAKYHSKCLVSLYNRASRLDTKADDTAS